MILAANVCVVISLTCAGVGMVVVAVAGVPGVTGEAAAEAWDLELGTDCVEEEEDVLIAAATGARGVIFGGGTSALSTLFS